MPRPTHAMGRPGTQVFPADWTDTHAAVVDTTLDCAVRIGVPGALPRWVEERKQTETQAQAPVYAGPASVTPVAEDSGGQPVVAQDVVPIRIYEVKLLHVAIGVQVDHVITIDVCPKDPMLVGRRLRVTGIEKGSRRFSRILTAVDAD